MVPRAKKWRLLALHASCDESCAHPCTARADCNLSARRDEYPVPRCSGNLRSRITIQEKLYNGHRKCMELQEAGNNLTRDRCAMQVGRAGATWALATQVAWRDHAHQASHRYSSPLSAQCDRIGCGWLGSVRRCRACAECRHAGSCRCRERHSLLRLSQPAHGQWHCGSNPQRVGRVVYQRAAATLLHGHN
jgi:hypothetical protein